MLETINNMLATHSAMKQQRDARVVDTDKGGNDKFSDHVNQADNQSQKERTKPEQTSSRSDDENVPQKQESDKPVRKKEKTEASSEVRSDEGGEVALDEEQEVSFETALLLLNEIQDGVEEGVEFIQAPTNTLVDLSEQGQGDGDALLAQLNQTSGEEQIVQLASNLTGEGEEGQQSGLQTALDGEGEVVVEEKAAVNPKDLIQTGALEKGQGKEKEQVITPLQRTGDESLRKAGDGEKGAETAALNTGEEGEGSLEETLSTTGEDQTGEGKEKKNQNRVNAAQNQVTFKPSQVNNAATQADTGITALHQTNNQGAASHINMQQGLGNSQQNQQVPLNNLAMHIAAQARSGSKRFDIRLDPPELGKIEVRLDVSKEGAVNTQIFVERSETLDLMQRDSKALEKALNEAGLNMKEGNLQFTLKEEGFQGEQSEDGDGSDVASDDADDDLVKDINVDYAMNVYGRNGSPAGLDIRV